MVFGNTDSVHFVVIYWFQSQFKSCVSEREREGEKVIVIGEHGMGSNATKRRAIMRLDWRLAPYVIKIEYVSRMASPLSFSSYYN